MTDCDYDCHCDCDSADPGPWCPCTVTFNSILFCYSVSIEQYYLFHSRKKNLNCSDQTLSTSLNFVTVLCRTLCSYLLFQLFSRLDPENFFVTWHLLEQPGKKAPEAREMHSTCCQYGNMLIIGGRNERGEILSDVWVLRCEGSSSSSVQQRVEGGDAVQLSPVGAGDTREDKAFLRDSELSTASELPEIPNESQADHIECGAANSGAVGGGEFTGVIQELDLSAKDQKWHKAETPIIAPAAAASLPSVYSNQLSWTMLDNLTLPVGRCAHAAAVSEGDVFVCGGFSEGGISDVVLKRALSPPLTPALHTGSASVSKSSDSKASHSIDEKEGESRGAVWCPITLEIATAKPPAMPATIAGRFGHAMCAVSDPLLGHIQRTVQSSSSKQNSHQQEARKEDANKLNPASQSALLIFGGVSAERDFGDMWLVTGGIRDSNS